MHLEPVHDAGRSVRSAIVALGGLGVAIVVAAWLGSSPGGPGPSLTPPEATGGIRAIATTGPAFAPDAPGPCLGPTTDLTNPARFSTPLAGSDVRGGAPVLVAGQGAPNGVIVQLTSSDGVSVSAPADALGDFSAQLTFVSPTQPEAVSVTAAAVGQDRLGASYCGAPLATVAFTVLPGADVSVWQPAAGRFVGPPFSVAGATAGAIAEVQVRLESPDGSLIDATSVATVPAGNGDHAFRSPPLQVEPADLGPAVLIVTWTDPRTGVQAPELVRSVVLASVPPAP
jgi:hypothetical protein